MADQPVSSVEAREPLSPTARALSNPESLTAKDQARFLKQLQGGAQRQLRDAQERLGRLAGTLGALSAAEPQLAAQAALRACAVRVQNLSYDLQRVGPATGLSATEPVGELEGA